MGASLLSQLGELRAPAHWQVLDFISDLHLHASAPLTQQAWASYMARSNADAIFILGDLFEVWVGDDGPDGDDADAGFERACLQVLHSAGQRCALYLLPGNRDFLLGPQSAARAHCTLLQDPTLLHFGGQRWLLSHGDALCVQDQDYQALRAQVRSPSWQQNFLAQSLPQRRAFAYSARAQSAAHKRSLQSYADVDAALARAWLFEAAAQELIHGHTHAPAEHELGAGLRRRVLSDWDLYAPVPRAQVLRLQLAAATSAVHIQRLPALTV